MDSVLQYRNLDFINAKKVIIFGCFRNARFFAMRLLNHNIKIDYFLCTVGEYMYPNILNKPVIGFEDCKKLKDIVIISPWVDFEEAKYVLKKEKLDTYLVEVEKLHPAIKGTSSLVIWGTGGRAKHFWQTYKECLNIKYFCDSNEKKAGTYFEGKEVIHFSALKSLPKDTVVVIASTFDKEIFAKAVECHIEEKNILTIENCFNELTAYSNEGKCYFYNEECLFRFFYNYKDKKVILYGECHVVRTLADKMKMLDFAFTKIVGRNAEKEDGTLYNLLYSIEPGEVVLLVDEPSSEMEKMLKSMGINYIWLINYDAFQGILQNCLLDPNLGHSLSKQNEEYAGFIKYEYKKENQKPIKIVSLGGSTTSAFWVSNKSWSEFLSEKLRSKGISHTIYCGGIQSYGVAQEFIKLVRDVLVLKPDIVISYSGANDMEFVGTRRVDYPFISEYQLLLFESLKNWEECSGYSTGKKEDINWGIKNSGAPFSYWYTMERLMNAVCKEVNIRFKAFLQPILFSKEKCCQDDVDVAAFYGYLYDMDKKEFCAINSNQYYTLALESAKMFRKNGAKVDETWFFDFSGIFDGERGMLYMDECHVFEKGNRIIADKIFEILQEDLAELAGIQKKEAD